MQISSCRPSRSATDRAEEGVSLPGRMLTPRASLTRRESEVLRLVAEGFTTREIAGHLYISHKTAQSHLRNAIKKMRGDPPNGGGAGVREPRRTPPSSGHASSSGDEPSGLGTAETRSPNG